MRLKSILLSTVAAGSLLQLSASTSMPYAAESAPLDNMGWFKKKSKTEIVADSTKKKGSYQEIIKNKPQQGLFSVYQKKNDFYFEVPASLLNRDMLVVNRLQRVPFELNDAGVNRGINYENQMVRFELNKADGKLMVRQSRALPLVPAEDAIAQSVRDNFISPLIADFKIEAYNADSTSYIIKVNDIYNGEETSFNNVFNSINLGTSANKDLSRILSIKSFENNIVATSELTTKVNEGLSSVYVTVEVSSSLVLLPEQPMMGRTDNQRIGYFTNMLYRFADNQQQAEKQEFVTRWRLEPKEEDKAAYLRGELVEPAKPIVFYIENSTPRQWRKHIKQGIEDWQVAFERAGFKNAIQAIEMTDSMQIDADDINYSVLTYAASTKANAMGPSVCDPRSGEIIEADIMWWHNVLSMLQQWITVQTGTVNPAAQGVVLPDSLMGDAMRFVACHEVGHSLGLRHNMMGSWAFATDSLRSKSFTDKVNSTSASIMDYARYNYVAQPGDGVTALTPNIGAYDLLAIEYGYRWFGKSTIEEEQTALRDLLDKHTGNLYKYSEAQDPRDAIDPRAQNEDLGDDPVKSSAYGIENLKRIMPQIIAWTTTGERGQTYKEASRLHYSIINQWNNYMYHVMANVGGIYLENTTVGDGVETFTYVEKAKQKEALQFIMDEALIYPTWLFDTELSKYTYLLKNTPMGTVENAPTQVLKNAHSYFFWDLLSNNRLMRMLENESIHGKEAFTAVELMDMLHKHVFGITERGGVPDVMARSLQKNFVDALVNAASESHTAKDAKKLMSEHFMFASQQPKCSCDDHQLRLLDQDRMGAQRTLNFYGIQINRVSDAISVKRGELMRIQSLLTKRANTSDLAAQYHYKDLILRINTALGL